MKTIMDKQGTIKDVDDNYELASDEARIYPHVVYHTIAGYESIIARVSFERSLKPAGGVQIKTMKELEDEQSTESYRQKKAELHAILNPPVIEKTDKEKLIDEGKTAQEADEIIALRDAGLTLEAAKIIQSKISATKTATLK